MHCNEQRLGGLLLRTEYSLFFDKAWAQRLNSQFVDKSFPGAQTLVNKTKLLVSICFAFRVVTSTLLGVRSQKPKVNIGLK